MNSIEYCRWLQGFCELQEDNAPPTEKQWLLIKQHLQLIFFKITDDIEVVSEEQSESMQTIGNLIKKYEKDIEDLQTPKKKPVAFCLPATGQNKICSNSDE